MLKILFNDGLVFKTFENGKIREYGCDFYNNYIDSARRAAKTPNGKRKARARDLWAFTKNRT